MVKASSQIEKELGLLQKRTEDMADALDPLYGGYLKALGEAGKQQLIAAAYHLCTQAYPDKFLSLSWQQRNNLQKSLQVLAAQIYTQLSAQQEQVKKNSRKPQRNNGLAFLQRLLAARASGAIIHTKEGSSDDLLDKLSEIARFESSTRRSSEESSEDKADNGENSKSDWETGLPDADQEDTLGTASFESFSLDIDEQLPDVETTENSSIPPKAFASEPSASEPDESDLKDSDADSEIDFEVDVPAAEQRLTFSEEDDLLGALEALARRSGEDEADTEGEEQPLSPVHLVKQQMLLEQAIQDVFKAISQEANSLLQKANVMPNFPKPLMAAAAETRGPGEPINAVPNVVKVSVRVMHGAANFELDEEDEEGDRTENRKSDRQARIRRLGPRSRRASDRNTHSHKGSSKDRRYRRNSNRSKDEFSDRFREEERSESRREELSGRFIPADAIEIEAFPEFAVINLQLSEVEFTDPRVSAWRNRLRKELANLKQLGTRYRKTQRSLEIAQAEDAWRGSWTGAEES